MTQRLDDALTFLRDYGESIEYHAAGASAPRPIVGIVDRSPPRPIGEDRRNLAPRLTIEVANHAIYGISLAELNKGADKIKIALRMGGTPELRSIATILEQDEAMWKMEVH